MFKLLAMNYSKFLAVVLHISTFFTSTKN